jgi:aspartate/methionine/tyrosine aminotransferase
MTILSIPVQSTEFPPIAEAFSWVRESPRNRPLLNMCQAVPSYPPADILQDEIARLAREPGTGGYTDIFGIPALRETYAAHIASDYGATILPKQVAITTGCNQAYAAAVMSVAQAGDNVILPAPWYFNHNMWLTIMGVEARAIPSFSADAAHPSVEDAARSIDSRTRAILLCTPNNPTGAIYPPEVIGAFFELAQQRGIALILDETYKDFRPTTSPAHQLFSRPDWDKTLIQLYSFSKIYALAGYRLGAMISGEKLLHEAAKVLDCMTICPPQITQRAVLFGIGALDQWKTEKKTLMRGRLDALRAAFASGETGYELVSSGAYFAYVKHPFAEASKPVAIRLAQQHDVLCLPGSMFGPGQEQYLRLAFANVDAELMPQLAERLKESLSKTG